MGYKDVAENHTYKKEILFTQRYGIMTGDENGNFNPESKLTKAELCVIIVNLFNLDYNSYRIETKEVPFYIPSWVYPYFCACQDAKLLPNQFGTTLKDIATEEDLIYIFKQAKHHCLPPSIESIVFIKFNSYFLEFSHAFLTRKKCAYLIFLFCKIVSIPILETLKNPKNPAVTEILPIYVRLFWIDFFYTPLYFDISLYQIYYTLKSLSSKNFDYVQQQLNLMLEISKKRDDYFLYKAKQPVYHYTTLVTMEILTRPKVNFRLSNSVYLNDPQEGLLASSLLTSLQHKYRRLRQFLISFQLSDSDASPYFIASFIKRADSLPMWIHYGAKGSGCCLGLDTRSLSEDIYEVTYSKKRILKFFSEILDILSSYTLDHPDISFYYDPVFQHAKRILNQSCYLYKDSAYEYEEEVRIVRFVPLQTAKAEDIGELFPKIYWETPLQTNRRDNIGLNFSSIILGPTVADPAKIATALAQRGYDSYIVQKSKIKFR